MFKYTTSGESHGPTLTVIVEGVPSGLKVDIDSIDHQLWRRQQGYGRGGRMRIESDKVEFLSGVRFGETLGSPICMQIRNKDWKNWSDKMSLFGDVSPNVVKVTRPRPGHADLAGALKYNHSDIRNVLERSSARSTATTVLVGSLLRQFLECFDIQIGSFVDSIGGIEKGEVNEPINPELSLVRVACKKQETKIIEVIDKAKLEGDTLGGVFQVEAHNVPVGLGSYVSNFDRLDGKLASAFMGIPAIKGVEIGLGFKSAMMEGSKVHDEISYNDGYIRSSNNAGGIEGGMSNGEKIVVRAAMKPLSTLYKPLSSVNMMTKQSELATIERSDTCAVPAASIVGESMMSIVLFECFLQKFSGDSIYETKQSYSSYIEQIKKR